MKSTNEISKQEVVKVGLREIVARKIGSQLEKMAVDPRGCWNFGIYEPEIPLDVLTDDPSN